MPFPITVAQDDKLIIDNRSSGGRVAASGAQWRLITDGVMGGISDGQLSSDVVDDRPCLRLKGNVKLDNNGGFIQAALDVSGSALQDIKTYTGIFVTVHGDGEQYNIHLRTRDNTLPWQSYRATFNAPPEWTQILLPFSDFVPYRTERLLDVTGLRRIGIVAIGREFGANLCVGVLGLYR